MLNRFKDTVKDFSSSVKETVTEKEIEESDIDPLLEQMRLKLLQSNVSLEAAESIEDNIRENLVGKTVPRRKVEENVNEAVENVLLEILDDEFDFVSEIEKSEKPATVFLIGFNGSGKTTTAAKLGNILQKKSMEVVLGAGDTFRAASIEQLKEHGDKLGAKVVAHEYESDPAAVGYDTVEHAKKNDKIAIVDTAGRSHSDENLMGELEKMVNVNEPDITFLVIDALAGNDIIEQAEAYEGMYDAIIVTKMDVDEAGGAIISISERSDKPVAYLGTGQGYEDLEKFDKKEFISKLLD